MPAIEVDHDWYFRIAGAANNASWCIREAVVTCAKNIDLYSGIAGDDEGGAEWGKTYDSVMPDFILNVCRLADACGSIASRAYQGGLNHLNAEFAASGGQGPAPQPPGPPPDSVDQRVPLAGPPSAVANNGEGLDTNIPELLDEIGVRVPNGNADHLIAVGTALAELRNTIADKTEDLIAATRPPTEPYGPDAEALYNEMTSNVIAPAGYIKEDATVLASAATDFGTAIVERRKDISDEMASLGTQLAITVVIGIAATVVTAGASDVAAAVVSGGRVARGGHRIYRVIQSLREETSTLNSKMSQLQAVGSVTAKLIETIGKPLTSFDVNEDGTIKSSGVFPKWKQDAWERYLANGGDLSMEEWSKKYDQLMKNISNGSEWDQKVKEILGYDEDKGWKSQYRDPEIADGRIWDFANPETRELIENKSGRLDYEQLEKDEIALRLGWNVTYNLKVPLPESQLRRLEELAEKYPDQFRYRVLEEG